MWNRLFPHEWYVPVPGARTPRPGSHVCLFVAPHPDDDVIGAGGMMALLGRARRSVVSVYVTDGAQPGRDRTHMAGQRRREAMKALHAVHARGAFFLPFTSRDVHERPVLVRAALRRILEAVQPRTFYMPCPFEQHATHRTVHRMALAGIRRLERAPDEVWGYAVWSAMPPAPMVRCVDITAVAGRKRGAIRCHASQMASKDFADGIFGLNRFAAVFSSLRPDNTHVRYVEQFLDMRMCVSGTGISAARLAARVFAQGRTLQERGSAR